METNCILNYLQTHTHSQSERRQLGLKLGEYVKLGQDVKPRYETLRNLTKFPLNATKVCATSPHQQLFHFATNTKTKIKKHPLLRITSSIHDDPPKCLKLF